MQSNFFSKLKGLGYPYGQSEETMCLENIRLNGRYIIFDLIAVGSHSAIYYGIEEATGQERAFKFYNLKEIYQGQSFKQKQLCKRLSNYEYQIMSRCNSMHILKCYDVFEDRDYKIIVYEYCNMGSLADELSKNQSKLINQLKAVMILKNIISALKNLHQNTRKLHKNLKTKNILIRNGVYKIIDFGLPTVIEGDSYEKSGSNFLIPEVMLKKNYDQKAQVWNVGVIFHQILFGEKPSALAHHNTKSYLISNSVKSIFNQKETRSYSQVALDFLKRSLATDPSERMTWEQLENHPLLLSQSNFKLNSQTLGNTSPRMVEDSSKLDRISLILPIQQDIDYPSLLAPTESTKSSKGAHGFYEQKFLLQIQKRELQKQLQKNYIKLGQSLQLAQIEPVSWKPLREGINKSEYEEYKFLNNYYLQCLKVDFVYYEIVKVMKELPSLEQDRKNVEFMYLLVSRCFFEISQIKTLKELPNQLDQQNFLYSCIQKEISKLYEEVTKSWKEYSRKLESQQNKWLNILSDKISKLRNSEGYEQKQMFFVAIEGKDYSRSEQIAYTIRFYEGEQIEKDLQLLLNEMANRKKFNKDYEKQENKVKRVLKYMSIYVNIWNLSIEQNSYASLKEYIDVELLHEKK